MSREVFAIIGAGEQILWTDASHSPVALPDSRARWEAIWSRKELIVELTHSHPVGPDTFSAEDVSTMEALELALGRALRFSLVTPGGYFVRGAGNEALSEPRPGWFETVKAESGF